MAGTVEFFFDFVSPYTYLAFTQIEPLVARAGGELRYRPFLLGGVMKATGGRPPIEVPAKGRYLFQDLDDWAQHYGVPIAFPGTFPANTLRAMRGAIVAERAGRGPAYRTGCFRAYWVEGRDLGDVEVLTDLATAAGLEREAFLAGIEAPDVKQELIATTNEAVERGAFGAPTFFVNGTRMYWGNDRLPFVEAALVASR